MNVLVSNATNPPALAVIRSLGRKGIEVTGGTLARNDFPVFSKYCKHRIYYGSDNAVERYSVYGLLNILRRKKYDVLIPVMEEDRLVELLEHRREIEEFTKLALPSSESFNVLNNKSEVSYLLQKYKIPGPRTYNIDSDEKLHKIASEATFPLIIKPRRGEGARGVTTVNSADDLFKYSVRISEKYGPVMVQEYIHGDKYTAAFILNDRSEPRRFFVHRALREYPVSGGPTCCLESVKYEPVYDYGLKLLKAIGFSGLASMEFIIDIRDGMPKIIDVNPRIYGPIQCAVSAGADLPYDLYMITLKGDIKEDFSYKAGVKCRNVLFEDTKHLFSIMKGTKSLKYKLDRTATLMNYLEFRGNSDFIISLSDIKPAFRKIINSLKNLIRNAGPKADRFKTPPASGHLPHERGGLTAP